MALESGSDSSSGSMAVKATTIVISNPEKELHDCEDTDPFRFFDMRNVTEKEPCTSSLRESTPIKRPPPVEKKSCVEKLKRVKGNFQNLMHIQVFITHNYLVHYTKEIPPTIKHRVLTNEDKKFVITVINGVEVTRDTLIKLKQEFGNLIPLALPHMLTPPAKVMILKIIHVCLKNSHHNGDHK